MERNKLIAGIVGLTVLYGVLVYGNLAGLGVWEPWEANSIVVAREYKERGPAPEINDPKATSYSWAVPTLEGKPVARPLLKSWLIGLNLKSGDIRAGELEWQARSWIAHICLLFVLGLFIWLRRFTSGRTALLGAGVLLTMPALFMGAHNLSAELLYLVFSSVALLALFAGTQAEDARARWLWGGLFGLGAALTFLDQRLVGINLILWVTAAWALTELAFESRHEPKVGKIEIASSAVLGTIALGAIIWSISAQKEDAYLPHRLQIAALIAPILLALGCVALARRTVVTRTLLSPPFLVGLAITAVVAIVVGHAYGEANPTLLLHGEVVGKIPALTFLLENQVFGKSLATSHMTFDLLVRQAGFSMVPWVALAPLALGYIARACRPGADDLNPQVRLQRFVLVWVTFAACVTAAASMYQHYFFPAYVPVAVAVALMMNDTDFWARVRVKPLISLAMGFAAICITLIFIKDLERFPVRYIELYTQLEPKFKLPDGFHFGATLKGFKYFSAALMALFFFGLGSTAVVWFRGAKALPARLRAWKQARGTDNPIAFWQPIESDMPIHERAKEKEAIRMQPGPLGKVLRLAELPESFGFILLAVFTLFAGMVAYNYEPKLTNHTSQRGVFETFQNAAKPGEKLYRYDVLGRDNSVYLAGIETIRNTREFLDKYKGEERFFAVIPRKNLARINYEVRRETKGNLPVLDARSSRLLLVSNKLEANETSQNFVAESIIEDESVIQFPVEFDTPEGKQHPVFDGQLEMLGFSLDHPLEKDGYAAYDWGEVAVVDYYFRVLKRVPNNQKIFLHVDYPGNRINGDHYPNDGDFPTNYWLPGDIVRSRHHLTIENYSTPGVYTLNFGFFVGSNRMKVTPAQAHDGGNRVRIGKFRVKSL